MTRFNYYIGIDISKKTLDVTILQECVNTTKTDYYKIENNEKSIAQFVKKTLGKYDLKQILFCFENTGVYSLPLSYYFSNNDLSYWKVPALEIKHSKGIPHCRNLRHHGASRDVRKIIRRNYNHQRSVVGNRNVFFKNRQ